MSALPVEDLELQALEQRQHLHERLRELKNKIGAAREKFDPRRNAHEHFTGLAIVSAAIGLASGYAVAGLFFNE